MNCDEAVKYIHSLERFGIKPGLERIAFICGKLGNPQNRLKFIHIAGTNGKGSTSTMTANILRSAGYRTGLYTSPYVIDFRERIQLDGRMIEPDDLAFCVEKVKGIIDSYSLEITEFEAVTAAAFCYFGLKECEYVVLEVGLGGRFDATNVIPAPAVTGIVSISLDHTAILGDTIEKIAAEKCGIIKSGSPVVSYPLQNSEALAVISETCRERNVPLIIPDISRLDIKDKSVHGTSVSYKGIDFLVPLAGEHMVFNAVTAVEIIKALDVTVRDEYISEGIGISVMPARMELISESPVTVLDGGHNEDCANALRGYIKSFLSDRRIIMVSSIMADKDYDSYLRIVGSCADVFIATKAGVPRALESSALCSDASKYCANCMEIGSPVEAVGKAMILAEKEDAVIVCGSFYLAGDVRDYLINGG